MGGGSSQRYGGLLEESDHPCRPCLVLRNTERSGRGESHNTARWHKETAATYACGSQYRHKCEGESKQPCMRIILSLPARQLSHMNDRSDYIMEQALSGGRVSAGKN